MEDLENLILDIYQHKTLIQNPKVEVEVDLEVKKDLEKDLEVEVEVEMDLDLGKHVILNPQVLFP